jgi:poly(beta-D-mannuronate) C5 epimerase
MTIPNRTRRARRAWAIGLTGALAAGVTAAVAQTPAEAAACSSPVKYAPTSNTIYLLTAQAWTPSAIKLACPAAPLVQVDAATHTWELSADLVLNNGATLQLHGSSGGGDVDTLRLRSLASNAATEVQAITAHWGTIDVDGVDITSWDDAASAPDTNPTVPAGATGVRGRAYIRAQSYLDNGTPRLSRMSFANSTVENLGWYAAESYGISWKSVGCQHNADPTTGNNPATCASAPVTGGATKTTFQKNYMGTYVWGGHGMTFTNDVFDHNVMYGLDTHDVTTDLDVEGNHFTNNGDHGFICSQHCDSLKVVGNESAYNGAVPWAGPNPSGETQGGQVHGIMLHRGITNTVVTGNNVHDQPNGAGIAIFDTVGQTVTGNTVTNNLYGIRISVGSANNVFSGNTVTGSTKYGVYTYKGSDTPETATSTAGRPAGNVFTSNTFSGSKVAAVNLTDTDGTRFDKDTFGGGAIRVSTSAGTRIAGGILAGQAVTAAASSTVASDVKLVDADVPTASTLADAYSKENITSTAGRIYLVGSAPYSQSVTPAGSTVTLTTAKTGTTSAVQVTPSNVSLLPSSSSVKASTAGGATPKISLMASTAGITVTIKVTGLKLSAPYAVSGGSTPTATVTSSAQGVLTFSRTLASTSTTSVTVSPK